MSDTEIEVPLPVAQRLQAARTAYADADQHYQACNQALQSHQAGVQAIQQQAQEQLPKVVQAVRQELLAEQLKKTPWKPALLLKGLQHRFPFANWAAWLYLLGIMYFFGFFGVMRANFALGLPYLVSGLFSVTGLLFVWLPYIVMVRAARRGSALQLLQKPYQQLAEQLATVSIHVLAFASEESGDSKYPYSAVIYPGENPSELGCTSFRLGQVARRYLGATLLQFTEQGQSAQPKRAWLAYLPEQKKLLLEGDHHFFMAERCQQHWIGLLGQHHTNLQQVVAASQSIRAAYQVLQTAYQQLQKCEQLASLWREVAVPDGLADKLIKLVDLFASRSEVSPKGILLYGPPGTGKTTIAELLAKTAGVHFMSVSESDLKGSYQGHTSPKVKAVFEAARKQSPCILFVDECEGIFKRRGGANSGGVNFDDELVKEFLSQWGGIAQGGQVMVVGATNLRDGIDDAILSRFTSVVEVGLPDARNREKILKAELLKAKLIAPAEMKAIVRETSGMSGRDLHQLVIAIAAELAGRNDPEAAEILKEVRRQRGKNSSHVSDLGWDDIVLPELVKKSFIHLGKMLRNSEELKKSGIDTPRGALLWGPPGTGKTQLARVLANEAGLAFLTCTTAELKQGTVGSSGNAVRSLFERARNQSPCILFIDEIEILAPARGAQNSNSATEEVVGQLLQEMDGAKSHQGLVFVLAASNLPDQIDSAVLSRLEQKLELPLPDRGGREAILQSLLRKKPLGFDVNEAAATLGKMTEGKSGRDLRTLVEVAARKATERALLSGEDIHPERNPVCLQMDDLLQQLEDSKQSTKVENLSWDDIVLPDELRQQFEALGRMIRNAEQLKASGITAPRSALLWGPPGTGKTQLARVLASQSGLSFFAPSTAEIQKQWIGHSGTAVKAMFDKARSQSPCILFIDEMEILAAKRGERSKSFSEEIIGQLLQEMDGAQSKQGQVFVLAASNHPELIDPAVLSRFAQKIELSLPDLAARQTIVRQLLRDKPLDFDVDIASLELAARTEGKSGRDLRSLIEIASNQATTRCLLRGDIDPVTNPIRIELQDLTRQLDEVVIQSETRFVV
ncbi:AAA family ATPase [Undibacterium rugosum]|uniref:AAA family ATPase n=1 Tax=Undibacterium rugosum TaxID=2762291 RepID=UPI001B83B56C|nr:ATP-binding protein [Undibacterium rugosum]MBR7780172.1 AAA family ATPase [Undibacterium rugosum]